MCIDFNVALFFSSTFEAVFQISKIVSIGCYEDNFSTIIDVIIFIFYLTFISDISTLQRPKQTLSVGVSCSQLVTVKSSDGYSCLLYSTVRVRGDSWALPGHINSKE